MDFPWRTVSHNQRVITDHHTTPLETLVKFSFGEGFIMVHLSELEIEGGVISPELNEWLNPMGDDC